MKNLKESIKKIVREFASQKSTSFKITEIKYFSPSGRKNVPNGHIMQKGGFIKECIDNSRKFKTENYQFLINEDLEIVEAIHGEFVFTLTSKNNTYLVRSSNPADKIIATFFSVAF